VAAVGANHGAGLLAALAALQKMGANGKPLAALPNVGLASLAGGRVIYPHATPEYFAEFAAHARDLGAKVIGGCCGTTPAEIAAIRSALEDERKPRAPLVFESPELVVALGEEQRETGLSRALAAGEWVVSVQLDPPLGGSSAGLVEVAAALKDSGLVGWVDINDNATARAGMSSLMVSAAIERQAGIETIPHLTTRDWSVMGLESMLLGTHAEGVRNVLAITGDPPEVGDYPGSRGVYEVDAIGLTQLLTNLNRGEDFNGRPIDAPTSFFYGVAVNPTPDDLEVEHERFQRKLEAGAQFAMTQIVFEPRLRRRIRRAARRHVADPRPARDLSAHELPPRCAPAQRGAGDRRPAEAAGRARTGRLQRRGGRVRSRARADRSRTGACRRRLPRGAVPAAAACPRAPLS
jgi:homocysteine S-methyltransferase